MEDNEKKLTSQTEGETIEDNDDNQYEHICYVCRRPESKAGKMITMPGGMCLCHDCMQKSFDAIMKNGMDFSQLQNMPYMNMNLNDFKNQNIQGMEIPKKQKNKKQKNQKQAKWFHCQASSAQIQKRKWSCGWSDDHQRESQKQQSHRWYLKPDNQLPESHGRTCLIV